jgi:hypothetical protein
MAAPLREPLTEIEQDLLFEVCVVTSIGNVYRDPKSRHAPDEAAYLLIARHARDLPADGHAEYRFPGHAEGITTLVTVQNEKVT